MTTSPNPPGPRLRLLPAFRLEGWRSIVFAFGVTLAAALARVLLDPLLGPTLEFALFYFSVMVAGFAGGARCALLATGFGAAMGAWLHLALGHVGDEVADDVVRLGLFLLFGVTSLLAERMRDALIERSALDTARRNQAEEALRDSEELHRRLIRVLPTAIYTCDASGVITFFNERAAEIWGRAPRPGDTDRRFFASLKLFHRDGRPLAHNQTPMALALSDGQARRSHELTIERPDGSHIALLANIDPIRDSKGNVTGAVNVFMDITARVEAEHKVEENRAQLESVYQAMADGVVVFDPQGRAIMVNDAEARICGYASADEMRRNLDYFARTFRLWDLNGRELPLAEWPVSRILRGESLAGLELRVRRMDSGAEWFIAFSGQAVRNQAGEQILGVVISRDITAQRMVDQALRQSEAQFRQLADAMPQLVWTARADGTVDYYNRRVTEYAGIQQAPNGSWIWEPVLHPDDIEPTVDAWTHALRTGEVYEIEHRVSMRDGMLRWHLSRGLPMRDDSGNVVKWFGTATDVHELRIARERMAAAQRSAEEANKAKDDFIAVLSHELRTPLTPVVTTLQMLIEDPGMPEWQLREHLELVRRNVEMEARLIDDLLDVTRILRGKIVLTPAPLRLDDVIRSALEVCGPDCRAKDLRVDLRMGDCAHSLVKGDPARLQQVFWNLLSNAVKFTPARGRITISCHSMNGSAVIEVADTGEGIDPQLLPGIFNAFEQGGPGVTRRFGGLGLGLTISKNLVELHGGTISARSEGKGKGAVIQVSLPVHREEAAGAGVPGDGDPVAGHQPAPGLRVLLVEDHRDTAKVLRLFLESRGHQVDVARSVEEALSTACEGTYELLLSDLGLPDGSGLELIRALRERGFQAPAIALSGYGQEEDLNKSREAGFNEHLIKPVDGRTLNDVVRKFADKTQED